MTTPILCQPLMFAFLTISSPRTIWYSLKGFNPRSKLLGNDGRYLHQLLKGRPRTSVEVISFSRAEGWSVWWDKSLGAADLYQDEIMKQLVSARAVITIWTENSIKSDWVRAEAGAAKKDGKLIPGLLMLPTPTFRCHSGRCTREYRFNRCNQGSSRSSTCQTDGTEIGVLADHRHIQIPSSDLDRHHR